VTWKDNLDGIFAGLSQPMATRDASGKVLNSIASRIPALIGGAADVAGSTRAGIKDESDFEPDNYGSRNLRFGLREHAMGGITNGLALHGGLIPFASTFLIFADYMRPAIRLAALMKIQVR
jgi:transketolase